MRTSEIKSKAILKAAALVAAILLFGVGASFAQQTINLTAAPTTVTLPDGSVVPMWGYFCGAAVAASTASCAALNPLAIGLAAATPTTPATWSPVVITVPYVSTGTSLTINLTNNLSFTGASIPTSLTIVGQLGGGLGTDRTTTPSPDHTFTQGCVTWPIADAPPGKPCTIGTASSTAVPPAQGPRVQSFSTEVPAVAVGSTTAPTALTWSALRPGTYLLESGTHPSIQGPMGLYGIVVVTTAPVTGTSAGCAYPGATACAVPYDAEIPLLLSEIDPLQNKTVQAAVNTTGFSETTVWSGQVGQCGNPASPNYLTCYPPAVNYTPLYYLVNGAAFNKAFPLGSWFPTSPSTGLTVGTGQVLVRLVNAGLRMHIPSIVGSQTGTAATVPPSSGFGLIAEDGNPLPGVTRVQSEVFMAAGKTYDVMINVPAAASNALPIFDRELSLSGNATARDAGMLAYIGVNGASLPTGALPGGANAVVANPDTYNSLVAGQTLTVLDPGKGVIANDVNVYGVTLMGTVAGLTLNPNGTFTYLGAPTSFMYCANGTVTGTTCSSKITATVTLGAAAPEASAGIVCTNPTFKSATAGYINIPAPGVLAYCKDTAGYPLTVALPVSGVTIEANGGFIATGASAFTFQAKSSQGTLSATVNVTLTYPTGNGPHVTLVDGKTHAALPSDYRWIIEEDRTFYVDPKCTTNPLPAGCPTVTTVLPNRPAVFGTNFHTSHMPMIATGCVGTNACEAGQTVLDPGTGSHNAAVCDAGNGVCDTTRTQQTAVDPTQVALDITKRYYISVLPGDAADPFNAGSGAACDPADPVNSPCGHTMGGAPIAWDATAGAWVNPGVPPIIAGSLNVIVEPTPLDTAKLSVFVFEDDFPLNGEQDGGGGIDVLSPNEGGLGGFQITLFDDAGGTGDATGQPTYDMFNMPLSNALAGTIDPSTGKDACPISKDATTGVDGVASPTGITGMIVTCPKYESDGTTLSPLAGHAVVANLYPGRYGVVANPGADQIARGEEWLQTNTLDGQKAHDSFMRVGEPSYFQEFGPAGYHVSIGFANPKIINDRGKIVCADPGNPCSHKVTGTVTTARNSRTPDERIYGSGNRNSFGFTQCYVSLGEADGQDFAFTKCDPDGNFTLQAPTGDWRVTIFDQWNDQIVDGISTPVRACGAGSPPGCSDTTAMGEIGANQWQANIYTRTYFDQNGNGIPDRDGSGNDLEPGLALVSINNRFRDGSFSNFNSTDLNGYAGFNEVFPLFSWYVVEADTTRYKNTGTHVVYDAGGPADGTCTSTTAKCGTSAIGANYANTYEDPTVALPTALRVPGSFYCPVADCIGATPPLPSHTANGAGGSTGRVDPPWVTTYGWQGFAGQNSFLEFGKTPFVPGETGGIHGHVVYYSTRPFDDPALDLQLSWTPLVPNVTMNLYQEGFAADNVTPTLKLVDTTQTSSWDDWAQGFRSDGVPNMNCPGQILGPTSTTPGDPFFYSLQDQPNYLDWYNVQHNGGTVTRLPNSSQFKCYDGMHMWNQLQPAPYDGRYEFPSILARNPQTGIPENPSTGQPAGTGTPGSRPGSNCTICVANPTDGTPMLPAGKYVVEVIVPPGYELVKEEDKNILIGDNYVAPVTQQFAGLGNVFILPDQAAITSMYNPYNAQNSTTDMGKPRHEGDTGSVESFHPCVGQSRVVPDYLSLFPQAQEVAPFAGATRNLCDRKEVTLEDQASVLAKFYIFTSTHAAAHYTGVITDDFTSEFDPFSPQFGEKFAPAYLPVSIKDFRGNEIARTYADQFGTYNGLNYSTWEVNPPNPTGYAPTMMVTCMNDPGNSGTPDNLWQAGYSQFCYELPFMPSQTGYFDTPVVPTSAFSEGYNHPDCNYPDGTPTIAEVDGDGIGPWVSAPGHTLTIHTINQVGVRCGTTSISVVGDACVDSYGYSGPSVNTTTYPWATQKVKRHFGFGSCTLIFGTCSNTSVTIGGAAATITSWSDQTITVTVPGNVPACAVQQQAQYGGPGNGPPGQSTRCGELVVTAANGKQSVDTVTVTVRGKTPTHVLPAASIQAAIDAAQPGDMLIIDPAAPGVPSIHHEMLLMWKPVRLQGVGALSSTIDASSHPAGELKLDPWRRRVVCLFGLALNGTPIDNTLDNNNQPKNPYDPSGTFNCSASMQLQVDRLPLEATIGWDASLNGNLAEFLQEPTLMGAYEGAAITALSKGVEYHGQNPWTGAAVAENGAFPDGTTLLNSGLSGVTGDANIFCHTLRSTGTSSTSNRIISQTNPYPSNFMCNPSSIDGLGISGSSQGGGGINVHGWGHNIQIANNRIHNNQGTLSGGITIGQGEHPGAYLAGAGAVTTVPGSCQSDAGLPANTALPFCFDVNVNVHNNNISLNSSEGDELFSSTPAGAGGATFCTGSDNYEFNFNWVCGNLSTGDGAGAAHLGFSYNADIEHNSILFNQSTNPTIVTNGGGLLAYASPDVDPTCGATNDKDCAPPGLGDGTGPNLVINANLLLGNAAESGSGGAMRLQNVNGTELTFFPNPGNCTGSSPQAAQNSCRWYMASVTNNIIVNNVAGLDGAVSLQDSLVVNFINNTVASNDSTGSSGILFNTLFAPLGSSSGASCVKPNGTQSCPQVAGLVTVRNSTALTSALTGPPLITLRCPAGHFTGAGNGLNGNCKSLSVPLLYNDVFWQNRSFFIGVGALGTGTQNTQSVVTLYNSFTTTPAQSQPTTDATQANGSGVIITGGTGACVLPNAAPNYWDLGVRGDTTRAGGSGFRLQPTYSQITDAADYGPLATTHNSASNPTFVRQYCNGSRVPPELTSMGYIVNPGTNETNFPVPIFNLTPSATVDEGNNWINMRFGPLDLTNPTVLGADGNYGGGLPLGNYAPAAGSPLANTGIGAQSGVALPPTDFFGHNRTGVPDKGAIQP
jgi:hypothetical protein